MAQGKKYDLSPLKLLKKYSNTDSVTNLEETKTFFCSELIAACYKSMGILRKDISSANYWPGSFSVDSDLKLLNEARLSEEMQIEFENS